MSAAIEILRKIETINANTKALTAEPVRPRIQSLIDAGLLKSSRMLCGPLALPTGEVWLRVTEDGRKLLA
ncbi:hypothetical protein [Hydrogenophaga defluvii]|uniref:Transcriptional regulator n=1 Tax=Hydrogenophaga defluvii TaxID=249410 RepID=A0ABW2SF41_9BURK